MIQILANCLETGAQQKLLLLMLLWEFQKYGVPYWGPYNKDPTFWGYCVSMASLTSAGAVSTECEHGDRSLQNCEQCEAHRTTMQDDRNTCQHVKGAKLGDPVI